MFNLTTNETFLNETTVIIPTLADMIIGVIYTFMGVFGILENGFTAYLMATDHQMKNPTYYYMINLSLTDVIILIPISLYAGLLLLCPILAHPVPLRLGAFLVAIGWYSGCLFMTLAAVSRYVQLAIPHEIPIYFSRRNLRISIALSWAIPAGLYTWFLYYSPAPFYFLPERYTWVFRRDEPFGNAMSLLNITVNSAFAICINVFNLKSLMCVRRLRRQVQTIENNTNMKREIKLFAQCAITGSMFTAAVIYYFAVSAIEDCLVWYEFLITHILWASNHVQNPIIYFCLNSRLRRRVVYIFCPSKLVHAHSTTARVILNR